MASIAAMPNKLRPILLALFLAAAAWASWAAAGAAVPTLDPRRQTPRS